MIRVEDMFGIYGAAFSVLAIAIAANGFRRGERWAWWALLVGNTIGYGAPMVYDQIVRAVASPRSMGHSPSQSGRRGSVAAES